MVDIELFELFCVFGEVRLDLVVLLLKHVALSPEPINLRHKSLKLLLLLMLSLLYSPPRLLLITLALLKIRDPLKCRLCTLALFPVQKWLTRDSPDGILKCLSFTIKAPQLVLEGLRLAELHMGDDVFVSERVIVDLGFLDLLDDFLHVDFAVDEDLFFLDKICLQRVKLVGNVS